MIKYARYGNAYVEVNVKSRIQQGKTVWRDKQGYTYADRNIKDWEDLSYTEKESVIMGRYEQDLAGIEWSIAKDPSLKDLRKKWEADAMSRRDKALRKAREESKEVAR